MNQSCDIKLIREKYEFSKNIYLFQLFVISFLKMILLVSAKISDERGDILLATTTTSSSKTILIGIESVGININNYTINSYQLLATYIWLIINSMYSRTLGSKIGSTDLILKLGISYSLLGFLIKMVAFSLIINFQGDPKVFSLFSLCAYVILIRITPNQAITRRSPSILGPRQCPSHAPPCQEEAEQEACYLLSAILWLL